MTPLDLAIAPGDTVTFTWTGSHNVAEVFSQSDYDTCNTGSSTLLSSTSPHTITYNTPGQFFNICTVGNHCASGGMKVRVTVSAPVPGLSLWGIAALVSTIAILGALVTHRRGLRHLQHPV